ncbi:MAG: hypothetical protein ACRD19_03555, partial [Terriglobia bacterium]
MQPESYPVEALDAEEGRSQRELHGGAVASPARLEKTIPWQGTAEIMEAGQRLQVPAVEIDGVKVIRQGGWLKIASLLDEEFLDGDPVPVPETMVKKIKTSGLGADIFTFAQKLPDVTPKYRYQMEWESMAAIPITTYSDWLEKRVTYDVRKAVRRSHRMGVEIRKAPFDDALVQGICNIYGECPVRQGKAFWHYRKDFATVREEQGTYPDRCCFIGAYSEGELIGFIRMIYM